jgi:hypothetical protein
VADELAATEPAGPLALGAALEQYGRRYPGPGAAVIVSDLMDDAAEIERGVVALRTRRFAVVLLHVVAPSELEPRRALRHGFLRDAESGALHSLRLSRAAFAQYGALLAAHLSALRALADRTESTYVRLVAGTSVAAFVTGELARVGLVHRR